MNKSICEINCGACELKDTCQGCPNPFGRGCVLAENTELKAQIIVEFNALGIEDMPEVIDLNCLCGSYINLEYTMASGQKIRFWNDNKIYLGNQLEKKNTNRCYGLTADEKNLLVCEYGENGIDPEIIVYKKWR